MGFNWKLYDDKSNLFFQKNFDYINDDSIQGVIQGWDFLYIENYHFIFSEKKSVYEMWDCGIKEGDVVLDLGANVGFFTRRAAKIASKVIAVDGSPESYSCLVENTADLPNVQTLNASILPDGADQSWLWTQKGNPLRMDIKSVMDLYGLDHIDFIKCDIEGGEYDLFLSDPDILSRVGKIAMETHHPEKNHLFGGLGKNLKYFDWYFGGPEPETFIYLT